MEKRSGFYQNNYCIISVPSRCEYPLVVVFEIDTSATAVSREIQMKLIISIIRNNHIVMYNFLSIYLLIQTLNFN